MNSGGNSTHYTYCTTLRTYTFCVILEALTADGEVYSWGEGDDGKLGHGDRRFVLF